MQQEDVKKMGAEIRRKFLSYLETKEVYELANIDEMSPELQKKMKEGKEIQLSLKQQKFSPLSPEEIIDKFIGFVDKK